MMYVCGCVGVCVCVWGGGGDEQLGTRKAMVSVAEVNDVSLLRCGSRLSVLVVEPPRSCISLLSPRTLQVVGVMSDKVQVVVCGEWRSAGGWCDERQSAGGCVW
jgi:hypothetical protein